MKGILFVLLIFASLGFTLQKKDSKKEEEYFSDIKEDPANIRYNHTSKFAFLNADYSGEIRCDLLNVDKSFEGKMVMFSAKQSHQVFPFYTTDDYRITISGNILLNG